MQLLWLTRLYTYNFPIDKGKGRVFRITKKLSRTREVIVPTRDGRWLQVALRDWGEDSIFFLGTYESYCTKVISKFVKPESVCLDVGANIGWYTTLFQSLGAEVHSFEPAPNAYSRLKQNVKLNDNSQSVHLNRFGLGDAPSVSDLHLPANEPEGHATLANIPSSTSIPIEIRTLDSYLIEKNIDHVDVVKVDIEGGELAFLKGASRLFKQDVPPVMLIEVSPGVARRFGYTSKDLLGFLRPFYRLAVIDEKAKRLTPAGNRVNANVLCRPWWSAEVQQ
jgi:FkbM family methyltransferase